MIEFKFVVYHLGLAREEDFDEKALVYRIEFIPFWEKEIKVTDRFLVDEKTVAKLPNMV